MTLEETLIQHLRALSPEQRKAVLDFTEFLRHRSESPRPSHHLKGLWADLEIDISESDISAARQEMWSHFPREISS